MDYRWQLLSATALIIMLIACPQCTRGQEEGEEKEVVVVEHYRFSETRHLEEETSSSGGGGSVQNNVKINTETSVRNINEDKVLVHHQQQQPQKGQRQKLNKHGNEIIINPGCVSLCNCSAAVIAINRL